MSLCLSIDLQTVNAGELLLTRSRVPVANSDIVLKTEISLITGVAVMVTFIACGVRLALVWGVMTFLLNFIPNVGSMMALIAPLPVILITLSKNLCVFEEASCY